LDRKYPANAGAVEDFELLCISKHNFLNSITENNTFSIKIIQILAHRLHYKSIMAGEISTQDSKHPVLQLIDYSISSLDFKKDTNGSCIDLT
jgi:CRP-like cAMP-binding protein